MGEEKYALIKCPLSFNHMLCLLLCCVWIGFHDILKVYLFGLQGIVFGTGIHSEFGNVFKMMKSEEVFLPVFCFCLSQLIRHLF